ncbi:unnamed protein product [Owenia fusiformis]|uniref:DNA helicase MCM8 n=1 Tax=Owenia fusiformis TaxID=6347 RepID=A0A8S4PG46_OWEFU|nr:unnamed protein product [Owenia fusiformis]
MDQPGYQSGGSRRGYNQSGHGYNQGGRGYNQGGQGYNQGGRGSWRGGRGSWRGRGNYRGYQGKSNTIATQRPRLVQTKIDSNCQYRGWDLYFPNEAHSDMSPTVQRVKVFEKYMQTWKALFNFRDIETRKCFTVSFKDLMNDQMIAEGLPNFKAEMKSMPETILSCLGLAMHQMMIKEFEHEAKEAADCMTPSIVGTPGVQPSRAEPPIEHEPYHLSLVHARMVNYEPIVALKNLKANYYGKFVSVKGTVVRVGNIKPLCTRLAFQCNSCNTLQVVSLPDGKYVQPSQCASTDCRGRQFIPKRSSSQTETIDWQTIRVQEIVTEDHRESGRIPRTVDLELTYDLVDSCVPGDMVTISGIVKVQSSDEGRGRQSKDKCMFLLYIYANSVQNSKGEKKSDSKSAGVAMDFTMKELYAIEEIQSEANLLKLITASLCPSIYGHEMVKAGLVLGLFGGSQKFVNDKNRIPVRGDAHILVVGDPGLGKSQMLQSVANVAPRSVYVCGNTTTTSGLTVTLSKDNAGGDYALEAGALVLADQGCCCIDEFDKMTSQHQALLEAMEQQSISIAKAGIVCSLPARTAIIAAANPVGGHYNKAKTVSENLKLGSALLSRFDLVFILLDRPDEEMDSLLSEHVMALHAGRKQSLGIATARRSGPSNDEDDETKRQWEADKPLSERIKVQRGEPIDPIPPQLLRKYVGYARKYVHPKISPEAASILQNFYLELRKHHQTQDSTPITTRQLESLIRLTEARARLELREVATESDAIDVVDIMKYSMMDTFSNELGFLDFQRSQHGSGMSSRSQAKKFIAVLQRVSEQTYNSLFTVQQMRQIAQEANIQVRAFEEFVSSLNNQGFLLKKGPRVYQLQTADC